MDSNEVLKYVKELGIPLTCVVACLYFYAAKIIPAQYKRDIEKDDHFAKSINEMANRLEQQAKMFADSQKLIVENFRAEQEFNRRQDNDVREHHKQVINDISEQTKGILEQNMKFLQTTQDNHRDYKEQTKVILDSIRGDIEELNKMMIKDIIMIGDKLNDVLTILRRES